MKFEIMKKPVRDTDFFIISKTIVAITIKE